MSESKALSYTCPCATCEIEVKAGAKPMFSGFCHCNTCRIARQSPVNFGCVWQVADVSVTKGKDNIAKFNIPGKKFEKNICKTCGDLLWILNGFGTYQTSGTQWLDSDKKVRPGLEPSAHLYYSERVTDSHNKDPLPKYLDFPKGFGGSDKTWSEEETKA
mmetsp:Transcript_20155/g.35932  ORF Transcript_20155/g.35932 Transcript_20155/m.35932 type:complete len:160 (-) Transcript_20155:300-779(-)|eukprot:CAMPEP_0197541600 /NCGR_PEP_ID=MMETSP1318-20131121/67250_1 /TAXON_ID=552666 /ORGANISM="Partenskyella glossopodia, Strain RCC365" /LENGTH=159 /DNA_ID=CAMNT_0043100793 /DNA_START=551 /DNA_END=1030 /DNA_ORIENTATION=+